MTKIGFPGLGIPEFELNRKAFTIPIGEGINIYWYGIIIACGIILAFSYFLWRAKKFEHIGEDDCYNIALFTVPIAIIGARTLYVLTEPDRFDSLWDAISIWNGGIAIYGAIIFGALTILVYSKIRKIQVLKVLDAVSPAVMIGQIMGRWGNFFNGEAYGWSPNVDKLPWRMKLDGAFREEIVDGVTTKISVEFVHPTFLYESLWNLTGFIIINSFYKKKKFTGQIFLMYAGWYGLGRGFIELLRTDSLYIFEVVKVNSLIGFSAFIAAIVGFVLLYKKSKGQTDELASYRAAYSEATEADKEQQTECEETENGSHT